VAAKVIAALDYWMVPPPRRGQRVTEVVAGSSGRRNHPVIEPLQ